MFADVCTHPLGIKVLLHCEAVHHTGSYALFHTGQEQHHQGNHLEVHPERGQKWSMYFSQ